MHSLPRRISEDATQNAEEQTQVAIIAFSMRNVDAVFRSTVTAAGRCKYCKMINTVNAVEIKTSMIKDAYIPHEFEDAF